MKFEIKNKYSGKVVFSIECDTWKKCVEAAIKAKADLSEANLSWAITSDNRYVFVGQIGSAKRTTIYDRVQDVVFCGCFKGTLKEFEARCKETHKNNKVYLAEYKSAIVFIKAVCKAREKENEHGI